VHRVGGHSEGLQIVSVDTQRGRLVLASDASHFYANMEKENPFPIVVNVADMLAGWRLIRKLSGNDMSRVIPGHDPLVSSRYRRAKGQENLFVLHEPPRD